MVSNIDHHAEPSHSTNRHDNTIGSRVQTKPGKQEGLYCGHVKDGYKLPVCDVDNEKRNFPGPKEYHFVTDEDFFKKGDGPGTTDTDAKTDPRKASNKPGYTKIYGGKGMKSDSWH